MATNGGETTTQKKRPNVVIIMADDMGFSDIGCFGSEIKTPNLDALAEDGIRMSQMYNCARCCPSRASLMTGLYPHQAGVGHMVHDSGVGKAYQGFLRDDCATMAEVMKMNGYKTLMTGKWHCGGDYPPHESEHWLKHAGDSKHPLPVQREFDEHYGTLGGAGSFYDPPTLIHNKDFIMETPNDYYYTDAINDQACRMIQQATRKDVPDKDTPFFLYVAHLAPHWPLHAPPGAISKYRGKYRGGWDELRHDRYSRLQASGMILDDWECSPRHEESIPWKDTPHKDWEDARMATYAGMIDVMDEGIGRIVQVLKDRDVYEDTIIIFLSDNGGCAEFLREDGREEGTWCENYAGVASDGTQTIVGNNPERMPGGRDSFMSYDVSWANASNTPFRLFKSWVHEGGIATPFLIHWSAGIDNPGRVHHHPWIMLDIVSTCYDVCGVLYPKEINCKSIPAQEGKSFAKIFEDNNAECRQPIFWEHQGNRAVREGKWKLVNQAGLDWELFNMDVDRTELNNLATREPERVKKMIAMWEEWAARCHVMPWPLHQEKEKEEDWSNRPWIW